MAQFYNFNRNFQGNNGYNNYNQGYFGQKFQRNNNQPMKKKSGCKTGIINKGNYQGKPWFYGWNYSKSRGLITFSAMPYKASKVYTSKNKKEHVPYMLEVTNKRTMQTFVVPCMLNKTDGKITCDKLGIVLNPRTNYCGTYFRRK